MKHFIITLLSALTLSVSGLALAGAPPVEAPVVQQKPVEQNPVQQSPAQQSPVQQEVIKTDKCDATASKCDTDQTADVTETETEVVQQQVTAS